MYRDQPAAYVTSADVRAVIFIGGHRPFHNRLSPIAGHPDNVFKVSLLLAAAIFKTGFLGEKCVDAITIMNDGLRSDIATVSVPCHTANVWRIANNWVLQQRFQQANVLPIEVEQKNFGGEMVRGKCGEPVVLEHR